MTDPSAASDPLVGLARLLADRGLASRRKAADLVTEGRVTVNGEVVANPAARVDPSRDHVKVDGKRLPDTPELLYLALHKPRGYLVTRDDPEDRSTVWALMPALRVKLEPVGRLDLQTEGLLLFTNDGDLAHRLTHPSYRVPRTYVAKVWRTPTEATLRRLERGGVRLDDGPASPVQVRVLDVTDATNAWLEVTCTEGRYRFVRRLLETVGHPVSKLRRERFGSVELGSLPRGEVRRLQLHEVKDLKALTDRVREAPPRRRGRRP